MLWTMQKTASKTKADE